MRTDYGDREIDQPGFNRQHKNKKCSLQRDRKSLVTAWRFCNVLTNPIIDESNLGGSISHFFCCQIFLTPQNIVLMGVQLKHKHYKRDF